MGRHRNTLTGVVVSVDDAKDDRFVGGPWEPLAADDTGDRPVDQSNGGKGTEPEPPPQGGKGSGEDAWRAYAEQVEVDVTEAKTRDEIVEALRAAGKPVGE